MEKLSGLRMKNQSKYLKYEEGPPNPSNLQPSARKGVLTQPLAGQLDYY